MGTYEDEWGFGGEAADLLFRSAEGVYYYSLTGLCSTILNWGYFEVVVVVRGAGILRVGDGSRWAVAGGKGRTARARLNHLSKKKKKDDDADHDGADDDDDDNADGDDDDDDEDDDDDAADDDDDDDDDDDE